MAFFRQLTLVALCFQPLFLGYPMLLHADALTAPIETPAQESEPELILSLDREPIFDYGFEAEFKGQPHSLIDYENSVVRTSRFYYLEPQYDYEDTGNQEVRSIGGETSRTEVRLQMQEVKDAVNSHKVAGTDGLKSFHLHIYINTKNVSPEQVQKLMGFGSRLGDYVMAWRLTHRRPYLALTSYSLQRSLPTAIDFHGTVNVKKRADGNYHDVEIRGGMDDIDFIMNCADIVERFWQNIDNVPDVSNLQTVLLNQSRGDRIDLLKSVENKLGRPLDDREKTFFEFLMHFVRAHSLPLMGAALDPAFNDTEKTLIATADEKFLNNVVGFILKNNGGYPSNVDMHTDTVENFLGLFRDWANDAHILAAHERVLHDLDTYQTSDLNQQVLPVDSMQNITLQNASTSLHTKNFGQNWSGLVGKCAGVFLPVLLR